MISNRHEHQDGFTLIELMIVVAIIGILASVAISSYQTYTIRAQVSEGLNLAGNALTPVSNFFMETGQAPENRAEAGMSANASDTFGNYVQAIAVVDGRVDITYGNRASAIIGNAVLTMTPYETDDGSVFWRCGHAAAPEDRAVVGFVRRQRQYRVADNGARPVAIGYFDPAVHYRKGLHVTAEGVAGISGHARFFPVLRCLAGLHEKI